MGHPSFLVVQVSVSTSTSLPVVFRSSFTEYKHTSSVEIKGD
jgi:hypothetical protein